MLRTKEDFEKSPPIGGPDDQVFQSLMFPVAYHRQCPKEKTMLVIIWLSNLASQQAFNIYELNLILEENKQGFQSFE